MKNQIKGIPREMNAFAISNRQFSAFLKKSPQNFFQAFLKKGPHSDPTRDPTRVWHPWSRVSQQNQATSLSACIFGLHLTALTSFCSMDCSAVYFFISTKPMLKRVTWFKILQQVRSIKAFLLLTWNLARKMKSTLTTLEEKSIYRPLTEIEQMDPLRCYNVF